VRESTEVAAYKWHLAAGFGNLLRHLIALFSPSFWKQGEVQIHEVASVPCAHDITLMGLQRPFHQEGADCVDARCNSHNVIFYRDHRST
jgi:hypothetical protein